MNPHAGERESTDDGFTLAELVISIMILGFITSAIGVTMSVGLRTASSAADRIESSRYAQTLAAFLPADLQGLRTTGGASTALMAASACDGAPTGIHVLTIAPPGSPESISYRLTGDAPLLHLTRVACASGHATTNVVVDGIASAADVTVTPSPLTAESALTKVTMTVTTHAGGSSVTFSVSGTPRAVAPGTCTIDSAVPTALTIDGNGHLAVAAPMTVVSIGECPHQLAATLVTGPAGALTTIPLNAPADGTTWTGTLPTALTWTPGAKTVNIYSGDAWVGLFTIAVVQPCALANPAPVATAMEIDAFGRLTSPAHVTVTTAGTCNAMSLRIATSGTPSTLTVPLSGGPTQWTSAEIMAQSATWTVGSKSVTLLSGNATAGAFAVPITGQPCAVSVPPVPPTPSTPSMLIDGTARPKTNVALSLTTTGVCGPLALSIPTGGTPDPLIVPFVGGPVNWTATIKPTSATWIVGDRTATVTNAGTALITFPFTVAPLPCAPGTPLLTPTSIRVDTNGHLLSPTTFTVNTTGVCGPMSLSVPIASGADAALAVTLTGGPTAWTGVVTATSATWTTGTKTVAVVNGTEPLATAPLVVVQACALVNAAPGTVQLGSTRKPLVATAVTMTTSGVCTAPTISVATGPGPGTTTINVALTAAGPNTWSVSIDTAATWTAGTKNVSVSDTGLAAGTFPLTVAQAPPCTFVNLTPSTFAVSSGPNGKILADANQPPIVVTTSGGCGPDMAVRFTQPGQFTPTTLALMPAATAPSVLPTTWTVDMVGRSWQKNKNVTFTVLNNQTSIGSKAVLS